MLTREEAKMKDCPIKKGNPNLLRSEYKCKAENCPKWRDEYQNKYLWCSNITYTNPTFSLGDTDVEYRGDVNEKGEYMTCRCIEEYEGIWQFTDDKEGNEIVQWDTKCPREFMVSIYSKYCNKCPHRYGYCQG